MTIRSEKNDKINDAWDALEEAKFESREIISSGTEFQIRIMLIKIDKKLAFHKWFIEMTLIMIYF